MRVVFLLNAPGGGATQGVIELLKALPPDAVVPHFAVPMPPDDRQAALWQSLGVGWTVVPVYWWNRKRHIPTWVRPFLAARHTIIGFAHLRGIRAMRRVIRTHEPDLVYTGTSLTVDGAVAARIDGIPHVWHVKETIGPGGRVQFPIPSRMAPRVICGLSERVVVMTDYIGRAFRECEPSRVRVIFDGVDVKAFASEAAGVALRHRYGIERECFLVGMSASLSAVWKEHDVFLAMAARIASRRPDVRFIAFGSEPKRTGRPWHDGSWHYYRALRDRAAALSLDGRLIWAGFHDDIPAIMNSIDVLVHPCRQEPFGRVAIEAMAAGTPVIGPRSGGIAESVLDGKTGILVTPGDDASFASAVESLLADDELRRAFGAASRNHATDTFGLADHADRVYSLFMEVARPAPRPRIQATGETQADGPRWRT